MKWKKLITDLLNSGLTQLEIADKCGCRQPTINRLKNEETEEPKYGLGESIVELHKSVIKNDKNSPAVKL